MQNSRDLYSLAPNVREIHNYQTGFVLVLTFVLSYVMPMSSKAQGLEKFEESFFRRDFVIENFNRLRIKLGDRVINRVSIFGVESIGLEIRP